MGFDPARTPTLIAGALMLAIGVVVVAVRPKDRQHQAFFLFAWCMAWGQMLIPWANPTDGLAGRLLIYFLAASPLATTYLGYRTLVASSVLRSRAWIGPTLAGLFIAVAAQYMLDPGPYITYPFRSTLLVSLRAFTWALLGTLLAVIAMRIDASGHRRSLRLMSVGLSIPMAFQVVRWLALEPPALDWSWSLAWFLDWCTMLVLATTVAILAARLDAPGGAALVVLAGLTGPFYGWLELTGVPPALRGLLVSLPAGIWSIIGYSMLGYALLHNRLFHMERAAHRLGRIAIVVLASSAAALAAWGRAPDEPWSVLRAVIAAIIITPPTIWMVRRVGQGARPGIGTTDEQRRRTELYRSAVQDAATQGHWDAPTCEQLMALQLRLGIPTPDAMRIERRALDGLAVTDLAARFRQ